MSINVLPHKKFDEWMADFQLGDSHPPMPDEAVISICCTPDIKHNYLEGHKHETDENWFKQNNAYFTEYDEDAISAITSVNGGKCEIMFSDFETYKTALDSLIGRRHLFKLDGVSGTVRYDRDDRMYTFRIL